MLQRYLALSGASGCPEIHILPLVLDSAACNQALDAQSPCNQGSACQSAANEPLGGSSLLVAAQLCGCKSKLLPGEANMQL